MQGFGSEKRHNCQDKGKLLYLLASSSIRLQVKRRGLARIHHLGITNGSVALLYCNRSFSYDTANEFQLLLGFHSRIDMGQIVNS